MKLDLLLSNQRKDIRILSHVLFWIVVETFYVIMYGSGRGMYFQVARDLLFTLPFDIAITYYNIFYLIPRFLLRKKYLQFFTLFFLAACIIVVIETAINRNIVEPLFYKEYLSMPYPFFSYRMLFLALYIYSIVILASAIKLLKYWYNTEQQKILLEIQNQAGELALLRSQINPHFLFNTLNNIDTLIHIDQDKASDSVHKLSEIMRYMLYEADRERVPLELEINYLRTYIDLQQMRIRNKNFIRFEVDGQAAARMIAPMMLIPFVENAFKHGDKQADTTSIFINLRISEDILIFEARNKCSQGQENLKDDTSGIGLVNVRRRLELLYPQKHLLQIGEKDGWFNVNLQIQLS